MSAADVALQSRQALLAALPSTEKIHLTTSSQDTIGTALQADGPAQQQLAALNLQWLATSVAPAAEEAPAKAEEKQKLLVSEPQQDDQTPTGTATRTTPTASSSRQHVTKLKEDRAVVSVPLEASAFTKVVDIVEAHVENMDAAPSSSAATGHNFSDTGAAAVRAAPASMSFEERLERYFEFYNKPIAAGSIAVLLKRFGPEDKQHELLARLDQQLGPEPPFPTTDEPRHHHANGVDGNASPSSRKMRLSTTFFVTAKESTDRSSGDTSNRPSGSSYFPPLPVRDPTSLARLQQQLLPTTTSSSSNCSTPSVAYYGVLEPQRQGKSTQVVPPQQQPAKAQEVDPTGWSHSETKPGWTPSEIPSKWRKPPDDYVVDIKRAFRPFK